MLERNQINMAEIDIIGSTNIITLYVLADFEFNRVVVFQNVALSHRHYQRLKFALGSQAKTVNEVRGESCNSTFSWQER